MTNTQERQISEVLPKISWETITPPYSNYNYFQDNQLQPFQYEARNFNLVNAWWLIEASILAYSEENLIKEKLTLAGIPEMRFFSGPSTQCYAANNDHWVFVVFRGTEINRRNGLFDFQNIIDDLKADFNFQLVDSGRAGKVHKGFKKALDEVWVEAGLLDYIKSKDDGKRTFWFAGHSLGAALATLAADRYNNVHGLYTYGSPRVGDEEFVKNYLVPVFRVVNNNDLVTQLPPPIIYRHVGMMKYLDSTGLLYENSELSEKLFDENSKKISDIPRSGIGLVVPDAILDHVPLIYSLYLWNNIVGK
jgi:triacylglycerol lipase